MASERYNHYMFRQNNSGGYFIGPEEFVVTATSEDAAWNILKSQPWFTVSHCKCCGERWIPLGWRISTEILG